MVSVGSAMMHSAETVHCIAWLEVKDTCARGFSIIMIGLGMVVGWWGKAWVT